MGLSTIILGAGVVMCMLKNAAPVVMNGATPVAGKCVMYGECNVDEKGMKQNCAYSGPPKNMTDVSGRERLRADCPNLFDENGDAFVCCSEAQIETLHDNLLKAAGIYSRCPSCFRNFFNMFCEVTCSPTQAEFMEAVETKTNAAGTKYVTELNVYTTQDSMDGLFDSCKGVVMPQNGKYATDIACGAYDASTCTTERWFKYMGEDNPFSPFPIKFVTSRGIFNDMSNKVMNIVRCNESADASSDPCSCVDCPMSCPSDDGSLFKPSKSVFIKVLGVDVFVLAAVLAYVVVLVATAALVRCQVLRRRKRQELAADRASISAAPENFSPTSGKGTSKPSRLEEWGYKWENVLEDGFRRLGFVCASNPLMVFFLASWLLAVLIYNVGSVQVVSNPVQLWASPTSQSRREKDYFDTHFGPFYRAEQIFIKAVNLPEISHEMPQGTVNFGPVFDKDFLLQVRELQMAIQDLGREEGMPLESVCFAPLQNDFTGPVTIDKCTIMTIWGYFQNSVEKFNKEGEKNGLKTNYLNVIYDCLQNSYDPSCLAPFGGAAENLLVVGGFLDDANKTMVQANALVLNFIVTNHVNPEDNKVAMEWEQKLINFLMDWEKTKKPENMDIAFMMERSIEDEIQRVSKTSLGIIMASYGCMFLYVALSLGRVTSWARVLVDSKIIVAVCGVATVALSVLAAIGWFAYLQIPAILLTLEAVPFLVLAVGVDNLFIVVGWHERLLDLDNNPKARPSAARVAATLGHAGPSMLLSTLAEEACFLVGSLSDMPAVRSFALLSAVALVINFLLQVTVLVAVLALHERRLLSRRLDGLCCLAATAPPPGHSGRFVERLFRRVLAPFLMRRSVRVAVPLAFAGMLLATLPCLPREKIGLDQSLSMTRDSYVFKYFEFMKDVLSIGPPVYFVVTEGLNYTKPEHQNLICGGIGCRSDSLLTAITAASKTPEWSHIARPASSWIDDLFDWTTLETCCKVFANNGSFCPHDRQSPECNTCAVSLEGSSKRPSGPDIRKFLPGFLMDIPDADCAKAGVASYSTGLNYVLDESGLADIGDSYFMGYHTPVRTSPDFYEAIRAGRKIAEQIEKKINSELQLEKHVSVFPYSVFYVYYEQYLSIVWVMAGSMLQSLCLLFLIMTLLNGFDLVASSIVSAIVIVMQLEMVAVMYLWGIDLNALSAVNLVVAMGIAVEFNSHVMHAFQKSTAPTRIARAQEALVDMGASVFSGIFLTKFSGIVILAFAPVQIMEVFYFRMYLTMVILGALHGLILLPVVLSFVGPKVNPARLQDIANWQRQDALLNGGPDTASNYTRQ
ncbi:NPC intracellular cholesterol transporter 1 homolog 1b-like [Thrips palmi]|uniref:NPC intracellular cholesterol transporter 1 homolog 1b-like n=1 Tax=Thrips palmi TaxID=161013 RepID=A0A6P8YMP0_THRPL|nr:NPC intracellular cholesterol transporter 1 homolog 1b-like [Thrips palmi]